MFLCRYTHPIYWAVSSLPIPCTSKALLPPASAVEVRIRAVFLCVCISVWVCETYVVHHLVSAGLSCASSNCVVHHQPVLCTMVHKGDLCLSELGLTSHPHTHTHIDAPLPVKLVDPLDACTCNKRQLFHIPKTSFGKRHFGKGSVPDPYSSRMGHTIGVYMPIPKLYHLDQLWNWSYASIPICVF